MLESLPNELKIKILYHMAVFAIPSLCEASHGFNQIFHVNEQKIYRDIMCRPYYQLASTLHPGPEQLDLQYFMEIEQRCAVATDLAYAFEGISTPEGKDTSVSPRQAVRLIPYLILLGHYLELYRGYLVSLPSGSRFSGSMFAPSDHIEGRVLRTYKNEETVYRLTIVYNWIEQHFREKLGALHSFQNWSRSSVEFLDDYPYDPHIGFLTFSGLVLIKDVMTHASDAAPKLCLAHYRRNTGRSIPSLPRNVVLSPSALPVLDTDETRRICKNLPLRFLEPEALSKYNFRPFYRQRRYEETTQLFHNLEHGTGEPNFVLTMEA